MITDTLPGLVIHGEGVLKVEVDITAEAGGEITETAEKEIETFSATLPPPTYFLS